MKTLSGRSIVVVGAGALGSACALAAARAGGRVTLIDSAPLAANASGIAAGMLAPAFESALDPVSAGQFVLLSAARDLWPGFVDDLGPTGLDRCGALLKASDHVLEAAWGRLRAQGCRVELTGDQLFTPDDWRIEPRLALAAFRQALIDLGGQTIRAQATRIESGVLHLDDGSSVGFDALVLACGFGGWPLAPELSVLTPIKGQLLRYADAGPREGPILRGERGYLAPGMEGAVVGATMEAGRSDLAVDSLATERLRAQAARLYPGLAAAKAEPFTGIRAATPDGLPMIGASSTPGVWLATGARRNGWLFAPLAAKLIIEAMTGNEDHAWKAAVFAPGRFPAGSAGAEHDGNADL
jgi:glycine oxidase